MVFASKTSKLPKVPPYNLLLTIFCSKEKDQAFVESRLDILNQCKVWWEPSQDVNVDLLVLFDPPVSLHQNSSMVLRPKSKVSST